MKRFIMITTLIACLAAAGGVRADDIDIYGSSSVSVSPNVLIIFDNSGSMTSETGTGLVYAYGTAFAGSYSRYAVYKKVNLKGGRYRYDLFTGDVNNITCAGPKNELINKGYDLNAGVSSTSFGCSKTKYDLYLGNWLNFDAAGGGTSTRIAVAKEVVKNLVQDPANASVRFGLMNFNANNIDDYWTETPPNLYLNGGHIVKGLGTPTAEMVAAIDAINANTWTPLAETLAEAGLYYAGKQSWYNSGVTYTSPIQNRCQKNYIILMTDGEPTKDSNSKLINSNYINGDKIADYDKDGSSGKLDDVSAYLFQNDLRADLGVAGESFQRQNIITHTIGFATDQTLLSDTAVNGGGRYFTATSASGLTAAFQSIMASIADVNAVFVSPVVPVSRMNRTFAGNSLYVGFFKPNPGGRWDGNIKKYGLAADGTMVDVFGIPATLADGAIKDNAQSYWSPIADGPDVLLGGVGGVLLGQGSRNLYTYLGSSTNLTNSSNAFSTANNTLTKEMLGATDATEREATINDIHGGDREWYLGDILHSQPVVVHYDTDSNCTLDNAFIFAGANDGMMHAFLDSDGSEQWGFIPQDHLEGLKDLRVDSSHDYFVDGAPVVYEAPPDPVCTTPSQKILFFGERRGGYTYTALDITAPAAPVWKYKIQQTHLEGVDGDGIGGPDGVNAKLGQSWSTPVKAKIKTSTSTSEMVFLLGGGYDPNQDKKAPPPTGTETIAPRAATDTMGRAVFTLRVSDGVVSKLNVNAGYNALMTHSITDVTGFDSNADGYVNRVYAGDLGGNIFAFEDDNGDGAWTWRKLFEARNPTPTPPNTVDTVQRKIMYAPDTTLELFGDLIFFGTGDRAAPEDTNVVDRLYAVKNEWTKPADWPVPNDPASFVPLDDDDLADVTDNLLILGTESERAATRLALQTKKGWYIRLENPGEKITASVTVFAGVVYFTTYTPEAGGSDPLDPCAGASGRGEARLYAVNYLTGGAVYDWSDEVEVTGDPTHEQVPLGKKDRSKLIGTSIPSAPVIAILPGGAKLYIGVEGGVTKEDPSAVTDVNPYYWRQLN